MTVKRIHIFDTTLRDGEQSPGCSMQLDEKTKIAHQLEALGVDIIEAGFPIASEGDFRAVKSISKECRNVTVAALCRTTEGDILRAADALGGAAHPRIHTFVATSDIHLEYKLKKSRNEILDMTGMAVKLAKSYADDVEFSAEDATRSDPDFLCDVFRVAADEGATVLNIPDTVGYTLPAEFAELIKKVKETVVKERKITISVHCHNDLGLAVANSLAAAAAGASQIECTVNGIGERAGNASLEEIVMACRVRNDHMPYQIEVNTAELYPTSQLLASIISFGVQPNKAIVGRNAFAHEAGIHQHGVLSNPLCYEIMTPESVGVPKNSLVLGKHSGRHALIARYREIGIEINNYDIKAVYSAFTDLADRKKKIYDQDLLAILPNSEAVSAIAAQKDSEISAASAS